METTSICTAQYVFSASRSFDLMLALNNLLDQVIKQTSVDVARIFLCDLKNKDLAIS